MIMTGKRILGFALLFLICLTYWYLTLDRRPDDLIAIVGDQKIFIYDVEQEIKRRGGRNRTQLDKHKLLDEMILRSAMIDQAIKSGIDQQPDFIRTYQNLLIGQYKKQFLKPLIDGVDFTADEIRSHYTANIDKYTQPAKARLAIIYMKTHSKMSDEKKQAVMNRMAEARQKAIEQTHGRGFGSIAVRYSEDQVSRYKGGDIGWLNENRAYRWDQKVINAGFALKNINDISAIISTDKGLYIVKLLNRRPSKVRPFDKVKGRIRHKQILVQRKQVEQDFSDDVREKTPVIIYNDAFEKVSVPKETSDKKIPVPTMR
ncbi:MAG: peptidyl-prolyl cis-trans isomerase C [Candidatus Magnetoglobus multicellularis str. Araruama]|uniref:peptidylprolyl isomerase n=1 Tax=Candidatus Magnetoglobus multicellularis str. Araruama TaxID=890399 RepID=A0A1V1PBW1_9BACT|nr:MAG: peptidyl-prolyl cis-trans isomerase C [Candidatus Magnetoglobus multicellularis str. Araruama]